MKKILFSVMVTLLGITSLSAAEIIFTPVTSHQILTNNTIEVTYSLACNQTFHKVVREEIDNGTQDAVHIHLGVLVVQDTQFPCLALPTDATASAGYAYSGRMYAIDYIGHTNN